MQMYMSVQINQGMQASCFYEWIKMPYIDVIVPQYMYPNLYMYIMQ